MVDLPEFQKRLQHYCRTAEYKQHQLARDIGLSPTAFSNKLNGTRGAPLSRSEIKNIITRLVQAQAITTRREVSELLSLMDLKEVIFSPVEWQTPPFSQLEHHEINSQVLINTNSIPAKTTFSLNNGLESKNGKNGYQQVLSFLFTNLAESTRLWQRYPDLMPEILLRHQQIVRDNIELQGGKVFKNTGRGLYASFNTPLAMVMAAVEIQRHLQTEEWPGAVGPLMVSMALHTGIPELEKDGDFFGQPINRLTELLALGQPGQILVTGVVAGLLLDQLPPHLKLRDLGNHHLKDLDRAEHIYQLEGEDLPAGFAPLASLENYPGNLPAQLTSFVGRESDQKEIQQLLANRRLVTLTGMGGVGKTRLALQIASRLSGAFKDGIWLVELAVITDPTFINPALARIFGLKEELNTPLIETLLRFLKKKQLLIVLDNCEHLIQECAVLADRLLRNCSGLTILATSREALEVTGETVRQLQALPVPPLTHSADQFSVCPSVQLFADRAEAVKAGFQITASNAHFVREICIHLDGIPLALELAAANLYTSTLSEIAASLDRRFQSFARGNRASQPRHQTLKALLDWSYNALSAQEQTLLRQLSVFPGSWQFAGMAVVCAQEAVSEKQLKQILLQLVRKSLVVAETQGQEARYRLLETIRLYGLDKLENFGEKKRLNCLYRNYYLKLAEECASRLSGSETDQWLAFLEREHDNFRYIIGQAISQSAITWHFNLETDKDALQLLLRMGSALGAFWIKQGYWSEGRRWFETTLAFTAKNPVEPLIEAKARLVAGDLAWTQGDYPQAKPLLKKSLELYQEQGDNPGISEALLALGKVASKQGYFEEALRMFTKSLQLKQEVDDIRGMAEVLNQQGQMAHNQFDYETARRCYRQSLDYYRQTGQKEGEASILNNLAAVAARLRDYTSGEALARESLQIYRQLANRPGIIAALNSLGIMAYRQSRIAEAIRIHNECLEMRQEMGDKPGMAASYQNLGNICYSEKKYKVARKHFVAALAIYREIGERNYFPRVINNLANIDLLEKNYKQAQASYEESLLIYQETGDVINCAITLGNLGLVAFLTGDYFKAQRDYQASVALCLELDSKTNLVYSLTGLTGVYYRLAEQLEHSTRPLQVARYNGYLHQTVRLLGAVSTLLPVLPSELGSSELKIYNDAAAGAKGRLSEKMFKDLLEEGQVNSIEVARRLVT